MINPAISQAGLSAVKASFTFDSFISILYKIFNNRWKSRSSKTAISPASQFCNASILEKNQPRIINIQVFEQKLLCYFNITFQNLSILYLFNLYLGRWLFSRYFILQRKIDNCVPITDSQIQVSVH
jgi:hypothetical protein